MELLIIFLLVFWVSTSVKKSIGSEKKTTDISSYEICYSEELILKLINF